MDKYHKWKVLLIIAVVAFSIWKFYPLDKKINLGLDLQGGMQLLLEVDLDKVPAAARADATERVVEVVRNRIDELGVREPVITKEGTNQVVVQLPGVTDRERAKEIVGKTAHLEFKIVSDSPDLSKKAEDGKTPDGYEYKEFENSKGSTSSVLLAQTAVLTGDHLTNASVGFDQYGQSIVQLQFDKEGAKIFDQVTFQNVGKQLAIVLDGKVHSAPVIRDRIPSGQAQISGSFSAQEASDLALVLRAGALPAPVHIVEERTVGPTLGRDSIEKGIKAGIIGAVLIFIFMPFYYLLTGLIADMGLIVYIIMVIGSLATLHSTLTLPGIAGFILSIGMAVDANVLISERIREELETGKTARAAVSAGYNRAFSAILDSHVTTLVTSVILFFFGTGPIKGFAVTLTAGMVASLFSSIVVTRVVFDFLLKQNPNLHFKMLHFFGKTNIHFLKGRFFAYGFSVIAIALGLSSFVMRGQTNFGIEFTGGTLVQIAFHKPLEIGVLRSGLEKEGVKGLMIQYYGDPASNQFVIKSADSDYENVEKAAKDISGVKSFELHRVDHVGPSVSGDLKGKAFWAVFWSSIGILIYLAYRFEWKFGLAAVIALLHDTFFTFGMYALTGREINLTTVAAILTIMGYSVSDTIITFDRVRENLKTMRKVPFSELVNISVNQTLGRTINSTLTTILGALSLFLFGGSAIHDFAFILLVGFSIGVYSTVFVASALIVDWRGQKAAPATAHAQAKSATKAKAKRP